MSTNTTRPEILLTDLLRDYKKLSWHIEDCLQARDDGEIPGWPDDVFIPFPAWMAIESCYSGNDQPTFEDVYEATRLETIGTWRYSKGLYRIDPSMFEAIASTEIKDVIPMRVFRRLPEKCIYIECPVGLEGGYGTIYGWFALLDYDYRSGAWELRIVEDNSAGHLFVAPFELTEGLDVRDSLATYATEGAKQFGAAPSGESISKARETLFEQVEPALKILMYLCSDEPEIANHDAQEGKHAAGIKRVKGRVRLFEQPKTRIWTIGEKTAAAIHAAESASTRQGRKSPHVRRAHWHGYWRGHRDGERQFGYKWLPPIIVNDDLIDTGGGEDTEE